MNRANLVLLRPLLFVFVLLNLLFTLWGNLLENKGMDRLLLIVGNIVVFGVVVVSFLLTKKSLSSSNPNSFVRAMYGGFIIKFFVLAIAAFIYIMVAQKDVNKSSLFTCMFLYIIYTCLEVSTLLRLLKHQKNA